MAGRIAFLINSLGKGGAERVCVNLMEQYVSDGWSVLLVTSRTQEEEYPCPEGVKRRFLEEEMKLRGTRLFGRLINRVMTLSAIWREERPEVIVSFIGKLNLYALMSAGRIPVVVSVRSDPAREYPGPADRILAGLLFPGARAVVLQVERTAGFFREAVREKCIVLPNILDPSFLAEPFTGEKDNEIVMVGRLDVNKNHALLIDAFSRICGDYPGLVVRIYGGGNGTDDTSQALKEQIDRLSLGSRVFLMGRSSDVRRAIEKARIYVLCSSYEGMPNGLLEAMATGLAVISTDCPCGGPASVIRDGGNGLLIPVDDGDALEAALRRILDNPGLEESLGKNARKIAVSLSRDRVCREWQKVISGNVRK